MFGFTVSLSTQSLELGEPLGIRIVSETPLKQYKCVFLNKRYHLFLDQSVSNDYTYVAYIGASRKQVSGDYMLIISLESEDGHHFYEHYNVSVNHPEMKKGRVNLTTKSKSVAKNVDASRYEYSLLSKKFNVVRMRNILKGLLHTYLAVFLLDLVKYVIIIMAVFLRMRELILQIVLVRLLRRLNRVRLF